jgi:putative addiction module component (TIGR02574 family)
MKQSVNFDLENAPMSEAVKTIVDAASQLSYQERWEIVDALADTLHPPEAASKPTTSLDPAWLAEIQRRTREFDEGRVKPVPWEEVRRKLDAEYGEANA